ncbi:efflux transporter outer membrane subunit [Rariglobus hedericola]|uniref:Efflux transporter outer membrane subunit n=1 Tax=Rariglobus hedericola TaxID=2597822 RepID=A0A556QGS9_9BACT|nr:efflux transporter outer membrane subunit [Rariglobus hedericola]TSJ75844.1 efflux transporter outer membrane subunit [Rariglobus hedericola]
MKTLLLSLTTAATAIAALPSVGPDYQRPDAPTPATYRDAADTTSVALAPDWWRAFNDPALDALITRALAANQDLRAALARVEQSRALAGVARSAYLPSLAADPSLTRERSSRTVDNALPDSPATTHRLSIDLSWELDLFGRVRRLNQSARADLDAAGATFAAARLSLTAEVATTHFTLRALDRELAIVTQTTAVRRDTLQLIQARVRQGTADDVALARAETELAATEADAAALAIRRSATQNALAVLLGEPAPSSDHSTLITQLSTPPPAIPAGLPGNLLTRRPDIAAAERSLAAASARIGVAKSAFFPTIALTGAAGYASADISDLTKPDSRLWSFGPSIYLPLFQGGRNKANLARSRAAYDEAAATYQQSVLVALREVQDALTASRLLGDQAAAQSRAVASARRGADLSQKRYDAGFVSYFEVVDAQRTALVVERADAQLAGQRWITHVALIKALGGGWSQPTS